MKNIIAITSLLVAGTALANAETVLLYDYASATDKDMSQNGWTYGGNYTTGQASYQGVMDASNSTFNSSTGQRDAWRICDGTTSGVGYFAYKNISNESIFSEDSFTVTFNMQLDTTAYYTNGSNGSSNFFNGDTTRESFSLLVGDGTGIYWAKFGYDGSKITVTDAATASSSATQLSSFSWNTLTDISITVDKVAGSAVFSVGDDSVSLTRSTSTLSPYKNTVLVGTVNASHQGDACFSSISLSTVVPEPSAFGLLAGAGALALVAARRRRKKA